MFIFDRTVSWDNSFVAISAEDWRSGVRSNRPNELDCFPIGLTNRQIEAAINGLEQRGAIRCYRYQTRTFYEIAYDFEVPGVRPVLVLEAWDFK
jgi:hypothetical protein